MENNQKNELKAILENGIKNLEIDIFDGKVKNNELYGSISDLADELQKVDSSVKVAKTDQTKNFPAFSLKNSNPTGQICYCSMPFHDEWEAFLSTIKMLTNGDIPNKELIQEFSGNISEKIVVESWIMPQCKFCPKVVETINALAVLNENVESVIIDASVFIEEAGKLGIRSTPTIIVGNEIRWIGQGDIRDILEVITNKQQTNWNKTLISQVKAGEIDAAVKTYSNHKECCQSVADLVRSEELSVRMGAMRVIEECAESNRDMLSGLIPKLTELLKNENSLIRGDAAYGLGLTGQKDAIEALEKCLKDPDPEVQETAQEAIDEIIQLNNK